MFSRGKNPFGSRPAPAVGSVRRAVFHVLFSDCHNFKAQPPSGVIAGRSMRAIVAVLSGTRGAEARLKFFVPRPFNHGQGPQEGPQRFRAFRDLLEVIHGSFLFLLFACGALPQFLRVNAKHSTKHFFRGNPRKGVQRPFCGLRADFRGKPVKTALIFPTASSACLSTSAARSSPGSGSTDTKIPYFRIQSGRTPLPP